MDKRGVLLHFPTVNFTYADLADYCVSEIRDPETRRHILKRAKEIMPEGAFEATADNIRSVFPERLRLLSPHFVFFLLDKRKGGRGILSS